MRSSAFTEADVFWSSAEAEAADDEDQLRCCKALTAQSLGDVQHSSSSSAPQATSNTTSKSQSRISQSAFGEGKILTYLGPSSREPKSGRAAD